MRLRAAAQGFTLLELLVVIIIVGVMVSAVSLTVGGGETRKLSDEAQRITALIDIASQEAILNGREMAMQLATDGYQFLIFDEESQEWQPIEGDTLRPRQMPEGIELSILVEGQEQKEDQQKSIFGEPQPSRIWILSSGEMSPFSLTLRMLDGPSYELTGDMLGKLNLEGPQG